MYRRTKIYKIIALALISVVFIGCGTNKASNKQSKLQDENMISENKAVTNLPQVDMTKWQYNADDDVYYQIGIQYCETPADLEYETLSIFVPGDYMSSEDNGDGTFTCELNKSATVGGYTAETAPMVIPVETPGYSACKALTEYTDVTQYTNAGFVYVHAGCRGRDQGAPTAVTDLKAAIRYIRYNSGVIAGNTDRIFSFGMSGGGAQSALLGATGDSEMYDSYLEAIGAVQGVSDAVAGSMCWCPITGLEAADSAYEWSMGTTRTNLSAEEQKLSDDLTTSFADYINNIGIKDENGNVLKLEQSDDGRYQAGSYYDYVKTVVENSLNNFLEDTTFPYNSDTASKKGGMMGGRGDMPDKAEMPEIPDKAEMPDKADMPEELPIEARDDISRMEASGAVQISGTYETAQDYINALNASFEWVSYDASTNKVTISNLTDFAKAVKPSSKGMAAFDQLDGGQGENTLFGYNDGKGAHFDSTMEQLLQGTEYEEAFKEDLAKKDSEGNEVQYRLNMYSPLYFLMESSEGYNTSNVAKYWRIRTGAWQSDTSMTTEINLALALENYDGVKDVDFETVWGQKHVEAERKGDSKENFINWVNECLSE